MKLIKVDETNLESEHICCAISNNKDCQVASKKGWLAERFADGLVFLKGDVRGKCFIEYIPAEKAWAPVTADGYTYIDCLWVSGQFKGHGYSTLLLDECIRDSKEKGKKGLVVLSSAKKMPFLADGKYLRYKGFVLADTAAPSFELMYLPFDKNASVPKFKENAKNPHIDDKGYVLYYTSQCPYTAKYVPLIQKIAEDRKVAFKTVHFESAEEAQASPVAVTTYALFKDGKYLTNEIQSEAKFNQLLDTD